MVLATAMELTDMLVLAMLDTMPMVPTTERGPLMPSPRLMPMPTTTELTVLATAMELTDMLVLAMLDMLPPMPTASKMSSQTQIIIAHQVQTEAQKQTKSRSN